MPRHALDVTGVLLEHCNRLEVIVPVFEIFPDPYRLVTGARREQRPGRRPRDGFHFAIVAVKKHREPPLLFVVVTVVMRAVPVRRGVVTKAPVLPSALRPPVAVPPPPDAHSRVEAARRENAFPLDVWLPGAAPDAALVPAGHRREEVEIGQGIDSHRLVGAACRDDGETRVRSREPGPLEGRRRKVGEEGECGGLRSHGLRGFHCAPAFVAAVRLVCR